MLPLAGASDIDPANRLRIYFAIMRVVFSCTTVLHDSLAYLARILF